MHKEFKKDFKKWNAVLLKDNTIRFRAPEVLFKIQSSRIKPRFQTILNNFFPRYIRLLKRFKKEVDEIRIEGHTSSLWKSAKTLKSRFLKNSKLSQERAHAVLKFCFSSRNKTVVRNRPWLIKVLRANGFAFALPIKFKGRENHRLSRRVEFKVKAKIEEKIEKILKQINK